MDSDLEGTAFWQRRQNNVTPAHSTALFFSIYDTKVGILEFLQFKRNKNEAHQDLNLQLRIGSGVSLTKHEG